MGMPKPIAIPATTGASTATRATLLISSVINNINKINNDAVSRILRSLCPITAATKSTIPETDMPLANESPPPNKIRIPHASFWVSFHSKMKSPFLRLNGNVNSAMAANILISVSDNPKLGNIELIKVLNTHKKMVTPNMISTIFSFPELKKYLNHCMKEGHSIQQDWPGGVVGVIQGVLEYRYISKLSYPVFPTCVILA